MSRRKQIFYSMSLLIVASVSSFTRSFSDCAQYKFGKFYIHDKTTRQRIDIERKDSLQIETNIATGDITVLNVTWKNDCEYELLFNYITPKEVSKSKRAQTIVETSANIPLRIRIMSGTDNYYVYEARKQGFKTVRDTVWLVK